MSEGAREYLAVKPPRGLTSRWRAVALGSTIIIFGVVVSHAIGLPLTTAGSTEAHVNVAPPIAYVGGAPADANPHGDALAYADAQRFTGRVGP
ncbi:MAG: hypothetical protein ACREBM_07250, partial [Sphingomicrobium sp.]